MCVERYERTVLDLMPNVRTWCQLSMHGSIYLLPNRLLIVANSLSLKNIEESCNYPQLPACSCLRCFGEPCSFLICPKICENYIFGLMYLVYVLIEGWWPLCPRLHSIHLYTCLILRVSLPHMNLAKPTVSQRSIWRKEKGPNSIQTTRHVNKADQQ